MEIRENAAKVNENKSMQSDPSRAGEVFVELGAKLNESFSKANADAFKEMFEGEPDEVELNELRDYRIGLGLTQKGVSHLTGIAQSTISAVERGEGEPNRATLEKIEKALNIKISANAIKPSEMRKEFIELIQELAIIDDNLELYRQKLTLVENEIEALMTDRVAIKKELESYKVTKVGESK